MNWTPDRPTKPGKYWLSLPKHTRAELDAMVGYETPPCFMATMFPHHIESLYINGALNSVRVQDWLASAQWLPYVEPPDPFAEGTRLIMVTMTVEERQTLSSALNIVAQSVREMPWDRPEDGDRARELASKMEALNTRLCEVPQ